MTLMLVPADKGNHIVYGYVFSFVIGLLYTLFTGTMFHPFYFVVVSFILGILKEGWDYWQNKKAVAAGFMPKHSVDPYDVLATTVGGLALYMPALVWYPI